MKLDRKKYELARARACMGQKDLVAAGNPERDIVRCSSGKYRSETGNSRENCESARR